MAFPTPTTDPHPPAGINSTPVFANQGVHLEAVQAAIGALGDAFGVGDGTIADVGAAFNQATLNNNFRDGADKINAIITALSDAGVTT